MKSKLTYKQAHSLKMTRELLRLKKKELEQQGIEKWKCRRY